MTSCELRFLVWTGTLLLAAAVPPAHAQDRDDPAARPPHLISTKGSVSVRHGDGQPRTTGLLDAPLVSEDRIATGAKALAELQLDSDNVLEAGPRSEIRLARLENGPYQVQLIQGAVTYRVLNDSRAHMQVDTPSVSVRPSHVGVYRIAVNQAGESQIVASQGNVEVTAPSGSRWVYTNQKMIARGPSTDPEFRIVSAISRWRRAATIMANVIQIASSISIGGGGGGGESSAAAGSRSTSKTTATAPSRPADTAKSSPPPTAAPRSDAARAGR